MNFSNKFFRNLAICLLAFFSFASVFVSNTKLSAESVQSNAVMVYVRPQVTCSASSTSLGTGGSTTWTATVLPAGPAYTYSWNVPGGTFVSAPTTNSATYSYSTSGTYTASVTVTPPSLGADPNGVTAAMLATTATCGSNVVVADPFNYSLSNSGNLNIVAGNSGSNVISTTLLTGTSQVVNLSMTSAPALPASIVPSWTTNTATTSVSKPLSFNVGATAPVGSSYTITITGSTAGLPNKTTTFTLTISGVVTNPTANISASPNPVSYGATPNIAWSSSNATACSATSANFSTTFAGVPNAALGVNPGVAQTTPTTYTVTCTGAIGTPPASASVSVPVLPEQPAPLLSPSPSCATGANVSMIVTWPSAALATSYKLHRSTSGSSGSYGQLPIGAPTSVTSPYVDSGLTAGTYYYQLQAVNAAGSSYSVPVSIIVPTCPPSFDYRLLNSGNITAVVGSSGSNTIIRELTSGTTQPVSLSITSGLPANTSYTILPASANPQSPAAAVGNSTLTITTTALTPPGSYTIVVTGAPLGRTTTFTLNVATRPPDPVAHISASPNPVSYGGTPNIAWYADNNPTSCISLSGNFSTTFSGTPNSVAGTNPGVLQNNPVNYTVSCSGAPGTNSSSASVNVNVLPQRPTLNAPSPSAACASNSAPISMILSWSNTALATSYKLHKSLTGASGSYNQLPIGAPTSVTSPYVDSGLTAGTYYYQLEAVNASGSSYSNPVAIIVPSCPPPFDYNLSNSGNIAVVVGSSGSNTIIRNLTSGTTQPVSLSITSGLPANTSYTILPASANPQSPAAAVGNSTLTITTTALTPPGSYTIVVTGAPLGRTTTFTLMVSGSAVNPIAYISGSPNPVAYGGTPNISWHGDYATSCTSLSGNFTTMNGVPNATNGTNPGVAQTTPTNYTVSCSGTPGSTPASASTNVTVLPQRPNINSATPSPACATGSDVTMNISWPDAALATSYKLHRSSTGASGSYSQLPIGAPTNVTSPYADTGLSAGTYYYQLQAVNASGSSYSSAFVVDVPTCAGFDYRMSATPTVSVNRGDFIANTITVNYVNGTSESVFLSIPANVLPPGVTLQSFAPVSCNPGATKCNIVLTLNTQPTTSTGTYTITVHGVSQDTSVARDVTFALVVNSGGGGGGGLNVSCSASPINVDLANNRSVTWTANVTNGTPPFTYTWSGDFPLAPDSPATTPSRTKTKTITYVDDVVNPKKGYITVIDSSDPVLSANSYQCPSTVDVVDTSRTPDFSITATPKVSMNFIGNSATSNIINVTINPIDGFSNDVALSGGPSSININGVDYPLTYEFYNHDTLDLNSTVANFRYGAGLDMVVKSSGQIPVGNYQVTVTGTSGTLVHAKQVILEVGTVRPIFQEF